MNSIFKLTTAGIFALSGLSPSHADPSHHTASESKDAASAAMEASNAKAPDSEISEGEIRKIDKAAGKITIRHGELKNLEMPPMTMVFQVKDKAMLDQLKTGEKINFVADKIEGRYTVTRFLKPE